MHELLAFSALHKAHKLPDQRAQYYAFGVHHQDLTIRGVREKLLNVTAHEASAIVATSTLLTLSVFASIGFELNYPEIPSSQGAIDGILNIFNLMQGMGDVLALAQVHVVNSFLAPMYRDSKEAIPSQPMLQELTQRIPTLTSFIEARSDLPESERATYLNAIGMFEPVLQMAMAPCVDNRELHFLFLWPMHLHSDFFGFLRQRHAGAMAIVMYYSTIICASQSRYWFMEGWGEQLIRACWEELGQDWRPIVSWPGSFINNHPTWNLFTNLVHMRHGPHIQLQPPSINTFTYAQRKPMEVAHRHHTAAPPMSRETKQELDTGPNSQQAMTSRSTHDPNSGTTIHANQSGPT
jgi:hypothetical protein